MKVCIGGITGWVGAALAEAVCADPDLDLRAGISRRAAGKQLSEVSRTACDAPIFYSIREALNVDFDIYVDFTHPDVAEDNIVTSIEAGRHVVVGTSGLSDKDYAQMDEHANRAGVSVLAAGNFAITAVLLQRFAQEAARYVPSYEVIDYAGAGKVDAPSGTVRELCHRLAPLEKAPLSVPIEATKGHLEARGFALEGTRFHSVRLPGHVLGVEVIFGAPDEKLILRHDAGTSAAPYVNGCLVAIRSMGKYVGLKRGLDSVM